MTQDFQRHFTLNACLHVNKNCCSFKCFMELFLSWLFVKIFFLSLCRLFSVVQSTSHAGVLKMPRASNEYGVLEVKWKRKWFWDLFLPGVFDFSKKYLFSFWTVTLPITGYCSFKLNTNSSHCKFGAWQNSEVARRTGHFGNWIKIGFFGKLLLKAHYYPAYYITADWLDWTVPSNGEFFVYKRLMFFSFLCFVVEKKHVLRLSWTLNDCNLSCTIILWKTVELWVKYGKKWPKLCPTSER